MSNRVTLLSSSWLARVVPNLEGKLHLRGNTAPPAPASQAYSPAPDAEFTKLDGSLLRLSDLRGQVVLLNFWATWCIPCREEIPVLNAMQHDLQSKGLKIVGASLEDSAAAVTSYQKDVRKFDYDVVVGDSGLKSKFAQAGLPTTYLIDREGKIRDKITGARDRAGWEAAIKPLLDETRVSSEKSD